MAKILLLSSLVLCALLLLGSQEPAQAARPTAYVRALRRGRVYVHRPNYTLYQPRWHKRGTVWNRLRPRRPKAHSTRSRL